MVQAVSVGATVVDSLRMLPLYGASPAAAKRQLLGRHCRCSREFDNKQHREASSSIPCIPNSNREPSRGGVCAH